MPKLDYIFKPSYDTLPGANVDISITDITNTAVTSAYAGELGRFTVVPVFLSASPEISNLNYKIDFGDGTISKDVSGKHFYDTPGEYKVSLIVTTNEGNLYRSNLTKTIKVRDVIPDIIHLNYGQNIYAQNPATGESLGIGYDIGDQPPSTITQEIIVTRYNSSITSTLMEQNDYKINLAVEGNETEFYTQQEFNADNNFQFKNTSFFANNRTFEFNVIDSVATNNVDIYAGYNEDLELIVKSKETLTDEEAKFTLNVGSSGTGSFYYYSDVASVIGSNIQTPVINCLPGESNINITDNILYINSLSSNYSVFVGDYILNVPVETPITILNIGNENKINIVSGDFYGNKNVYNTNADGNYNFYHGKVKIRVTDSFDAISFSTFSESTLSGAHILNYNINCNHDALRSKL